MKRKIKVSASYQGVLPVASFSNLRPGFSAEMEFEQEFKSEEEVLLAIEATQQRLNEVCYSAFEGEAEKARIIKIQQDLKNFRFYTTEEGEKWPSLTSFLFYDKDFFVEDEELKQYASQGNLIDMEFKHFVDTGKFLGSEKLLECTADRFIIKKGNLHLSLDGWDIESFLENYPFKSLKTHKKPMFNRELKYGCLPDLEGVPDVEKGKWKETGALAVPSMIEIKRTKNETDNLKQLAGQSKCEGNEHIEQMIIIPINDKTKQGFSRPTVSRDIDKYYELCKFTRNDFKKIYGV